MTYLPITPYTTQVDYTIASLNDIEDLVALSIVTKALVSGSTYRYIFPISGSFGVKGLINLGGNFIDFTIDEGQKVSFYGLDPGNSGFTSSYAGATIRVQGATVDAPGTNSRIHFHGILITNTSSSGHCLTATGTGTVTQRLLFQACTFRQGPVAQSRLVLLYGGGIQFVACDFCRSIGAGTLTCFIAEADTFNTWGTASFINCGFNGRISESDTSITTTSLLSRNTAAGGSPVTTFSFNGCYVSHVGYVSGSVAGQAAGASLVGCYLGEINNLSNLAVQGNYYAADFSAYSTDIQRLNGVSITGGYPAVAYTNKVYNIATDNYIDGYGFYDNMTVAPAAAVDNYYFAGLEEVKFIRLNPAANSTISGFVSNGVAAIQKIIVNISDYTVTLKHETTGSSPQNRFTNNTGADIVLSKFNIVRVIYDRIAARWRVMS